MPSGSKMKPERSITAATRSDRAGRLTRASSEASARPIWPKPRSTTSIRSRPDDRPAGNAGELKAAWIRRWASAASAAATTTEMFSSEEP